MFIDEVAVHVQSGQGGRGCESYFRRSDKKFVPTGGDGGKGGNVVLRADRNVTGLVDFLYRRHFQAESGHAGSSNQKRGRDGKDLMIRVPCGTTVINKTEYLLVRDLVDEGDEVIVLQGGRGGRGNQHGREATHGEMGPEMDLVLSFKIKADIFLVGEPNSGKSQLLRTLTRARVKPESYPFSTKNPQLGAFITENYRTVTLCELPALVRGSSKGKGLGNRFLKHLERAKLLFLMLDPLREDFDLERSVEMLHEELTAYDPRLAAIPRFILIGKMDEASVREKLNGQLKNFKEKCFPFSATTGLGLDELMDQAERRLFP